MPDPNALPSVATAASILDSDVLAVLWFAAVDAPDGKALDEITFEADALYIMDKAYIDFERLHKIHKSSAFFITRAKVNLAP